MNMEKFTRKSLEAIREAQQVAIEHQNMQIDQQHLLYALTAQQEGLIPQLFTALNIEPQRVLSACEREIERIPKVSGPGRDPVSYTHLDVYKRQEIFGICILSSCGIRHGRKAARSLERPGREGPAAKQKRPEDELQPLARAAQSFWRSASNS